ncbi:MAG: TlpA family protein disulfide reductase [Acidobacteriia bacterium]|nr:TlpA family protein disulfide reductase [Terriglobia bacterium]
MKRPYTFLPMGIVLLAIAGIGAFGQGTPAKPYRAPDFTLADWQGNKVSLTEFRGRAVLLQFFQTGCPVCQREAPLLEQVYREYKDQGLVVIGVSHDAGGPVALKQFAKRFDLTYFLLLGDLEIAVRYLGITPQVSSFDVPHFFLINKDGNIVKEIAPDKDKTFAQDEKGRLEQAVLEVLHSPSAQRPKPAATSH